MFLCVLNFLLLEKCKRFTIYDEIHNFERKLNLRHTTLENKLQNRAFDWHKAFFCVFSLSLPCLLKMKDVTDTLTNDDIHFIAYFSCYYQTFNSKYSFFTFAIHSKLNYKHLYRDLSAIPQ